MAQRGDTKRKDTDPGCPCEVPGDGTRESIRVKYDLFAFPFTCRDHGYAWSDPYSSHTLLEQEEALELCRRIPRWHELSWPERKVALALCPEFARHRNACVRWWFAAGTRALQEEGYGLHRPGMLVLDDAECAALQLGDILRTIREDFSMSARSLGLTGEWDCALERLRVRIHGRRPQPPYTMLAQRDAVVPGSGKRRYRRAAVDAFLKRLVEEGRRRGRKRADRDPGLAIARALDRKELDRRLPSRREAHGG